MKSLLEMSHFLSHSACLESFPWFATRSAPSGSQAETARQGVDQLARKGNGYRRQLTFTPTGVIAEETADDPALTEAIRAHAREVTGFVQQGMPAMMQHMMGGCMMGPGGLMGPGGVMGSRGGP